MGGYAWCAGFAQVGSRAFVETVVSCALTHGVEIFKCSVNEKDFNQWRRHAVYSLAIPNRTGGNRSCEPAWLRNLYFTARSFAAGLFASAVLFLGLFRVFRRQYSLFSC